MACAQQWDTLAVKTESLSEILLVRASWQDPWLNIIPRGEYPRGEGYTRTTFTIGRVEPTTDEETWVELAPVSAQHLDGHCSTTYNGVYTGYHADNYQPEEFGLKGPLVCQKELGQAFQSEEFWEKYFQALEKRNRKSVINRLGNVYMQYVPKASANAAFTWYDGDIATQSPPAGPTMTDLDGANLPTSELTQEMLDSTGETLIEEGAHVPDSNGFITMGDQGPEYPLLIGTWMSKRLAINNSELRADLNSGFQSRADVNPVLRRMGASRVIGNFRHVVNPFPPRWRVTNNLLVRVPTWVMSTNATYATKGQVAIINPDWRDPSIAAYEGAIVLSRWVMTEEVLRPVNSAPGMKWDPLNYFGAWQFVTGNDALLGFDDCTGVTDPLKNFGRHFAQYEHALKPMYPSYGRLILFKRCANSFDTITCS